MITYDQDSQIYYSTKVNDSGFFSGFSTKAQGDGRQVQNILNFLKTNELSFNNLVTLGQIHSANAEVFNQKETVSGNLIKIDDTDGVVTSLAKTYLTVITGDCLPMIFCDKKTGIIGISHQGWRGSIKKLGLKIIDIMVNMGARKTAIIVAMGPAIGACCYNIDEERYYSFLEEFDSYSDKIFTVNRGKRHLNLAYLNYLLLLDEGINRSNIDFFPFCTSCNKGRFYSFRRDAKKNYGEMFSFIIKNHD